MKLIDETGNIYGYLTVIKRGPNQGTRATWVCKCKCGNETIVTGKNLRSGNTKSCGCIHAQVMQEYHKNKHIDMIGQIYNYLKVLDFGDYAIRPDGKKDQKMKCECLLCGSQIQVRCSDLKLGNQKSCGCINSKGNTEIKLFLLQHNINFKTEYRFIDCKDKRPLPFDFAFFDTQDNVIAVLEYQGIQHFICEQHGWDNEEKFKVVQKHDQIKKQYCLEQNIKLFEITYQDNISDKIKEIINELYG